MSIPRSISGFGQSRLASAGSAVLIFAAAMGRLRQNLLVLLLLAAPLLLHTIFWFLTIPQPKFFLLAAWLFALCPGLTFINRGVQIGFASSVGNLCLNVLPLILVLWEFPDTWSKLGSLPPKLQVVETVAMTNPHGVRLWVPLDGEQTFDSPIPSGQAPVPELAFLNPEKGPAWRLQISRSELLPLAVGNFSNRLPISNGPPGRSIEL